jgi:hypothetical protein
MKCRDAIQANSAAAPQNYWPQKRHKQRKTTNRSAGDTRLFSAGGFLRPMTFE